ncbi:hypothetical protein [Deinococcus altitudinis]|uniref:hypothetical protein n=1 Tax=Deinococcus altitudinis TaxID=468914 RepID=UPI00389203A5
MAFPVEFPAALLLLPAGSDVPGLTRLVGPPFELRAMPTTPDALRDMVWRVGSREEQERTYTHLFALHGPSEPAESWRDAFFTLIDRIEGHTPHVVSCTVSGDRNFR